MKVSQASIALALSLAFARADSMQEILNRMDAAAPKFNSMTAKFKMRDYNKRWDESDDSEGTVNMRRTKNGPEGVWDLTGQDPQTVSLSGHEGRVFKPRAKVQQVYKAGKYVSVLQETLLLGFGARVADLQKTYEIVDGGQEMIGSKHAIRLQLTPKSKDVKDIYTKIDLWVADGESTPTQEKIWKDAKGDYKLVTFSDITINPSLPDSAFKFSPPTGTQTIQAN